MTSKEGYNNKVDLLYQILPFEWRKIMYQGHQTLVLTLAVTGGSTAVARYLFGLDEFAVDFGVFESDFHSRNKFIITRDKLGLFIT